MLEQRLSTFLKRIGEADRNLQAQGEDPTEFHLLLALGGSPSILHDAWDPSWPTPSAQDIDDLAELGLVRLHAPGNSARVFSITVKGREEARRLEPSNQSRSGGRAPSAVKVLEWLIATEQDAPEAFDLPKRLIDRAVSAGFIVADTRDALAERILGLKDQGYLSASFVPEIQQASPEETLTMARGLELTVEAHDRAAKTRGPAGIRFYGSVVAGQIAAGNITNYVSFGEVLDRAEQELARLEDIDPAAKEEAGKLIQALRGKASEAGGLVLTGAGGQLLGSVLGQLMGLGPA